MFAFYIVGEEPYNWIGQRAVELNINTHKKDLRLNAKVIIKKVNMVVSGCSFGNCRKFHIVLWQTSTSKNATVLKYVPQVEHVYFSLFNQSDHCFLAFSLPLLSSLLKLSN